MYIYFREELRFFSMQWSIPFHKHGTSRCLSIITSLCPNHVSLDTEEVNAINISGFFVNPMPYPRFGLTYTHQSNQVQQITLGGYKSTCLSSQFDPWLTGWNRECRWHACGRAVIIRQLLAGRSFSCPRNPQTR